MGETSAITGSTDRGAKQIMHYDANKKSVGVAFALWFFFGLLGGHRFYIGLTASAVIMLLIFIVSFVLSFVLVGFFGLALLGLWALIDAFRIPAWVRGYNNRLIALMT